MRQTALSLAMIVGTTAMAGGEKPMMATIDLVPVSNVTIDPIFETFVGSDDPEAATFDVTGSIVLEASEFDNPEFVLLHTLSLNFVADFSGAADVDPELGTAEYTLSVTAIDFVGKPVGNVLKLERGSELSFPDIPVDITASDSSTGTDLAGVGDYSHPAPGMLGGGNPYAATLSNFVVTSTDGTVSVSADITIEPIALMYEIGLVETRIETFTATINGEGDDPFAGGCNEADLSEPFGIHDLADITTFVSAFAATDPIADIDNNGLFDLDDITAFVTAFGAGCP